VCAELYRGRGVKGRGPGNSPFDPAKRGKRAKRERRAVLWVARSSAAKKSKGEDGSCPELRGKSAVKMLSTAKGAVSVGGHPGYPWGLKEGDEGSGCVRKIPKKRVVFLTPWRKRRRRNMGGRAWGLEQSKKKSRVRAQQNDRRLLPECCRGNKFKRKCNRRAQKRCGGVRKKQAEEGTRSGSRFGRNLTSPQISTNRCDK